MSGSEESLSVSERCASCKQALGYDVEWEDPPEVNDGHIEATWNPDEPEFAVAQTRRYCSPGCLIADLDRTPFDYQQEGEV